MTFRPKATGLFGRLLGFSLRSLQRWQQPQLCSHGNPLRSLAQLCLPVCYQFGNTQAEQASSDTGFLLQGYDAGKTFWDVQRSGAMTEGKVWGVGRGTETCMSTTTGPKTTVESALLSAIPSRSLHSMGSSKPGRARSRLPCKYVGCKVKQSNFGFPDEDGTRCHRHRLPGMLILQAGCEVPGCNTQASFSFPGAKKSARCKAHRLEGMVNNRSPACTAADCTRQAVYGPEGKQSPTVCRDHVVEGMIPIHSVPSQRCCSPACMAQGFYGHFSDKRHKFCSKHKSGSMVALGNCRCEEEGCTKPARFGWPNMGAWLRCTEHRQDGMVSKPQRQCTAEGCLKQATFGYPGDGPVSWCKTHAEKGMVYRWHKMMCDAQGCREKAFYGLPGERASRCGKHKGVGMVHVVKKLCEVSGCNNVATFGVRGQARTLCASHKEEGMSRAKQK